MNPNTLELITNELAELNRLRLFKANVTKLLFDDLGLPEGVQHNDRDLYDCIEGLRNLQTGFDEYDPEDGEYVKHHPSYKELQAENTRVKFQNEKQLKERMDIFVGKKQYQPHYIKKLKEENTILKAENQDLQLRAPMPVEYYDNAIGNLEEEIKTYKETLDEHFHHYDLLKEKKKKEIEGLKANIQVVWEVLGESSYADELNKRLFPENFEEED